MTRATAKAAGDMGANHRSAVLFAVALLGFVAGRCLVPMDETDLFYNLRLGEIVLATRSVPRTNLLSFTFPDYPDPNLAWVFQVLLALAHRAGGIPGTVVLKTCFVVATFALLYRVAIRRGAHPALAAAALALAAWAAEPRFVERPHLITLLGLGVLLLTLERAEAGRSRSLWALIPLGLVWANGNSCFFLAPAVLSAYALGAHLNRSPSDAVHRTGRAAGWVAVALCPLLFATPSGAGWLGYVANHFRMPHLRPLQEYRPAEWPTDGPFLFLLGAVALVTILPVGGAARTLPIEETGLSAHHGDAGLFRHLLPILALALLGSRRIRFVAEFALLAGPFVAARATEVMRRMVAPRPRAARVGSTVVALAMAALTVSPRIGAAAGRFHLQIEEGLVPVAAIRWIDSHGLRQRMYNDLEVGSYLTWDGWPQTRVFQDPRINGYPSELHATLRRQDLSRREWESLLGRFAVRAALITYPDLNPRAALFDADRWALVYRTTEALVFVRRESMHAALIEAEELPLTFRFDAATGVEPVAIDRAPGASPVRPCEWNRRLGDWFVAAGDGARAAVAYRAALSHAAGCLAPKARAAVGEQAAALALRHGEPARAVDLLKGLSSPAAGINRGFALVQLGRPADALQEFTEAAGRAPDDPQAAFGQALALFRLGRNDEATPALQMFLRRWPDHLAAPEARALLDRNVARAGARR